MQLPEAIKIFQKFSQFFFSYELLGYWDKD